MVEQKTKSKEITIQPPAPERRGKVVDIFAALKQSLEQAGAATATPTGSAEREKDIAKAAKA